MAVGLLKLTLNRASISKTFDKLSVTENKVDGISTNMEVIRGDVAEIKRDFHESTEEINTELKHIRRLSDSTEE